MCNNKENAMNKVIDIVVDCCATDLGNGRKSLTREDVLGKRKDENICMTRTILVNQLLWAGFTVSTVSALLHRTPQAIRRINSQNTSYIASSRAYRIALSEATIRCKDIEPRGV